MENFFTKLDLIAGLETENKIAVWLERLAFIFLILMVLSAPHSIAATQIALVLGILFWLARFFVKPHPKFIKTALFIPLLAFFGWSVLTAIFSYAPDISLDKLRNVSLLIIFFFAINNLRTIKAVKFLAFALIFSCMINVVWTPVNRLIGRGVEINNVKSESPLIKAGLREGDTVVEADGEKVYSPEGLLDKIEQNNISKVNFYRPDFYLTVDVKKSDLLAGGNALEKLGVGNWKKSRNWRSSGFYGMYATYAEVLQLIASLTLGLFIAGFVWQKGKKQKAKGENKNKPQTKKIPFLRVAVLPFLLFVCVGLMTLALLLTVTRASQGAFIVSAFSIVLLGASRKMIIIALLIAIPVIIGGLFFLQQSREVGFYDTKDDSILWRQTVYREGFQLWTKNARNFTTGVGMDSIKRYKEEWKLFDNGKLPPGHFHSTPLQLLVERGFPALILWLLILGIYAFKMLKTLRQNKFKDWIEKGIVLGCFGGLVGFFTSGLVHYNLGDSEVSMVFYLLMAFAIRIVSREKIEKTEMV
ncbi:MAG: O-antigen ligase family protein [Acidobacteriota bacterium]|nr:O-antigen ligase family protein [Acidobacteriota bacterium]